MHHALAGVEGLVEQRAQLGLVGGVDDHIAHRQLERVLLEAIETRPGIDLHELAIDAQVRVAAPLGPLGEVGVDALARDHQRREHADVLAGMVAQDLRGDALGALRLHRGAVPDRGFEPPFLDCRDGGLFQLRMGGFQNGRLLHVALVIHQEIDGYQTGAAIV